jgi:hypothetical protein
MLEIASTAITIPLPISIFFPVLITPRDISTVATSGSGGCPCAWNSRRNRAHAIRYGDAGSKVPAEPIYGAEYRIARHM